MRFSSPAQALRQARHKSQGAVSTNKLRWAIIFSSNARFQAQARVFAGPPDFAPDRRPFLSLADDVADRDLALNDIEVDRTIVSEVEKEITDLFQRGLVAKQPDTAGMGLGIWWPPARIHSRLYLFKSRLADGSGPGFPKCLKKSGWPISTWARKQWKWGRKAV
jgi:hypothetical protein